MVGCQEKKGVDSASTEGEAVVEERGVAAFPAEAFENVTPDEAKAMRVLEMAFAALRMNAELGGEPMVAVLNYNLEPPAVGMTEEEEWGMLELPAFMLTPKRLVEEGGIIEGTKTSCEVCVSKLSTYDCAKSALKTAREKKKLTVEIEHVDGSCFKLTWEK